MSEKQLKFVYLQPFNKKWQKFGLSDMDKEDMESQIAKFEENPDNKGKVLGAVIEGTGGATKWRYTSEKDNIGKSGAYRIIYFVRFNKNYYFLDIYAKSNKVSLTSAEKNTIKKFIKAFAKKMKG